MKKISALILSILMVIALCSCSPAPAEMPAESQAPEKAEEATEADANTEEIEAPAEDPTPFAGLPNPMTEHSSLSEINELVGSNLCHPAVPGVTDEKFFTIDCGAYTIAEYDFSLYGNEYCFRCAPTAQEDISGVYTGEDTAFSGAASDETEYCVTDDAKLARWFDINGQYVFCVTDHGGMDEETFKGIADEMRSITSPGMTDQELAAYYDSLAGEYQDSWSMRAGAEITSSGSDGVHILIHWGSSASETYIWTMDAARAEDGLLYYGNCICEIHTFDNNGNETVTPDDFPADGFFTEADGILFWTGAGDEDCSGCTFEKMPG